MALDLKKSSQNLKLPSVPWVKLAKLTRVHKLLVAVVVVGALWGGFVWFLYLPKTERIEGLEMEVRTAKVQLDRLRQVEKNLREFKKDYRETEMRFKQALRLLPDKEEIPTLLSSISNLGAESGLEFILFQPQNEITRNFYAEIPLKLELSGPYHNVASFFDRVSRLSRIVNIGNMRMTIAERAGDQVILRTDCTATTYKFIEPPSEEKKPRGRRRR